MAFVIGRVGYLKIYRYGLTVAEGRVLEADFPFRGVVIDRNGCDGVRNSQVYLGAACIDLRT